MRWVVVVVTLVAARAWGSTVVGLSESRLVADAAAVVVGRVGDVVGRTEGAETLVALDVEEVLRGVDVPARLWLRLPGDGVTVVFSGVPAVRRGERVLVLVDADGGRLTPVGLGLGWFRLEGGRAWRNPGAVPRALGVGGVRAVSRIVSEARLRARALAGRGKASVATASARLAARAAGSSARRLAEGMTPPGRWFEPDEGAAIAFDVDARGDRGLGLLATVDAVRNAIAAWSVAPGASLRVVPGSLTALVTRPTAGRGRVTFDDPGDDIPRPRRCTGILALGGYRVDATRTIEMEGAVYAPIVRGEVVFADGWSRCRFWRAVNLEEVLAHEIGHAVGLAHLSEPDAIMVARAHLDGRGARLTASDARALAALYPGERVPDADGDGVPDATDRCPTTPDRAQADRDGDRIGDLCDRCPTLPGEAGDGCAALAVERLNLAFGRAVTRVWGRLVVPRTVVSGSESVAVELRDGDGVLVRSGGASAIRVRVRPHGVTARLVVRARRSRGTRMPPRQLSVVVRGRTAASAVVGCRAASRRRLECGSGR